MEGVEGYGCNQCGRRFPTTRERTLHELNDHPSKPAATPSGSAASEATRVCPHCKEDIPKSASRCKHCGGKTTDPRITMWCIAIAVLLVAGGWLWGQIFPKGPESYNEGGAIVTCQQMVEARYPGVVVDHAGILDTVAVDDGNDQWVVRSHFDIGIDRYPYYCSARWNGEEWVPGQLDIENP